MVQVDRRFVSPFPHAWRDCIRCGLSQTRRIVVLGKGDVPAKIMFVGEGPGLTEDLRGEPFVGPSGRCLRDGLHLAADMVDVDIMKVTYYLTNLVACHPTDTFAGSNRAPSAEEIQECAPRLQQEYKLVQPKVIVALGKAAKKVLQKIEGWNVRSVYHPAYILRTGGTESAHWLTWCRKLSEALKDVQKRHNLRDQH